MKDRLVSVVIPFYENFPWLKEALCSVFSQTYADIEVIVVNDGSPEDDAPFLSEFGNRVKYLKTENKGASSARNLGIEHSKGEFIAFLDSDDLWRTDKLERQIAAMTANGWYWSHTGYYLFDDKKGIRLKDIEVSGFKGDVFLKCLISSPIATPCVVVRKDVFLKNPDLRFNSDFRFGEDGLLWLSISKTFELGVVSDSLTGVRIRGNNAAQRAMVYLEARAQLFGYVKNESRVDEKFAKIPSLIKLGLLMSSCGFQVVRRIESSIKISQKSIEILAKAFYLMPYLLFKTLKYSKFYDVQK